MSNILGELEEFFFCYSEPESELKPNPSLKKCEAVLFERQGRNESKEPSLLNYLVSDAFLFANFNSSKSQIFAVELVLDHYLF